MYDKILDVSASRIEYGILPGNNTLCNVISPDDIGEFASIVPPD